MNNKDEDRIQITITSHQRTSDRNSLVLIVSIRLFVAHVSFKTSQLFSYSCILNSHRLNYITIVVHSFLRSLSSIHCRWEDQILHSCSTLLLVSNVIFPYLIRILNFSKAYFAVPISLLILPVLLFCCCFCFIRVLFFYLYLLKGPVYIVFPNVTFVI